MQSEAGAGPEPFPKPGSRQRVVYPPELEAAEARRVVGRRSPSQGSGDDQGPPDRLPPDTVGLALSGGAWPS